MDQTLTTLVLLVAKMKLHTCRARGYLQVHDYVLLHVLTGLHTRTAPENRQKSVTDGTELRKGSHEQ